MMRKAIAIGILGLVLSPAGVTAQTAGEQARILGEFQRTVLDYAHNRTPSLDCSLEAAPAPAPRIFTLPVAMVFRQLIAKAVAERGELVVREALPVLPDTLEYRVVSGDLVIRDTQAGSVVGVLRDAFGAISTMRH